MKVLIISAHPLSWKDNNSITFAGLFSSFQPSELAQIVIGHPLVNPDLVSKWCVIGAENSKVEMLVRSIIKSPPGSIGKTSEVRDSMTANQGRQLWLTSYADIMPLAFTPEQTKWLRDFSPEVIYTTSASIRTIKTALWAQKTLGTPIVIHYMDDWIDTLYKGTIFPRWLLLKYNRKIIQKSSYCLAISPKMAENYRDRFKRNFEHFMYCLDIDEKPDVSLNNDELHLAYIGGLHLQRADMLEFLGKVLLDYAGKIDSVPVTIDCYAPEEHLNQHRNRLEKAGVRCVRSLKPEEVIEVIKNYHSFIHVESFEPRIFEYTKFSCSTKIPIYLSGGKPVLAIGPQNQAAVEYICANEAGVGVFRLEREEIMTALRKLINAENRREMGENAYNLALKNHQRIKESGRFRRVLEEAVLKKF